MSTLATISLIPGFEKATSRFYDQTEAMLFWSKDEAASVWPWLINEGWDKTAKVKKSEGEESEEKSGVEENEIDVVR